MYMSTTFTSLTRAPGGTDYGHRLCSGKIDREVFIRVSPLSNKQPEG